MSPRGWFFFAAGAGTIVGFALLLLERRPLGGTITIGTPRVWSAPPP